MKKIIKLFLTILFAGLGFICFIEGVIVINLGKYFFGAFFIVGGIFWFLNIDTIENFLNNIWKFKK